MVGTDERKVTLEVHASPQIEGSGEIREITINVNETAEMVCTVRAEKFDRKWFHEGKPVNTFGSELFFSGEGNLKIQSAQLRHQGRYVCLVSNVAGNDSVTYILHVRGLSALSFAYHRKFYLI